MQTVIRSKLAKLIPMLASDNEGEVVATVRAIDRTLKAASSDSHALADPIEAEPAATRSWFVPRPEPFDPDAPPRWNELCRSESDAWLDLFANAAWVGPWERSLATNLRQQIYCQPHRSLTPRQKGVLTSLIAKAMKRGERP